MSFRLFYIHLSILLLCTLLFANPGEEYPRLESLLNMLRVQHGEILFPETFQNFEVEVDHFTNQVARDEPNIRNEKYRELVKALQSWIAIAGETRKNLSSLLAARQKAVGAEAESYAPVIFARAESKLKEAAQHFAKGKIAGGEQKAREAEKLFQQAELQSIRNSLIGKVRILIRESMDLQSEKYAPESLARTQKLFDQLESMLEQKDPDYDEVSSLSQELLISARHLLFFAQTTHHLYQSPENAETFLANMENPLKQLSAEVNYLPQFSAGFEKILSELQLAVQNIKDKNKRLEERNLQLEKENLELERELLRYKSLAGQQEFLQKKIDRVKIMVDGRAVEEGGFLTIRLDSLTFEEDRADITPETAARLANVTKALREFPDYPVILQYVQKSTGNLTYNQNLASRRANAISEYIQSNLLFRGQYLQSTGMLEDSEFSINDPFSHLEIIIDLKPYWSFGKFQSDGEIALPPKSLNE